MVVRRAVPADAETLTEFAARTYYETFASVNTPENMRAYLSAAFSLPQLNAELSDPRGTFYLVQTDGGLSAYAKLFAGNAPECITGADPIELVRFYVDQRWHGKGVGSALME